MSRVVLSVAVLLIAAAITGTAALRVTPDTTAELTRKDKKKLVSPASDTKPLGKNKKLTTTYANVPGLQFVGNGVNIVTMQLGLGPVLDNTFSSTYTWTNNITKTTYLVPTQMIPKSLAFSKYSNATQTYKGLQDMQLTREVTTHWHSGFLGMDSHSKTTYNYLHQYYQNGNSLSESALDIEFLELTAPVLPFAPLTTSFEFQQAWKALPDTCCDSASGFKMFEEFFTYTGHAFMDSAKFGGRVRGQTWFNRCFFKKQSVNWVNQQSGWSFLGIIGEGHNSHKSEKHLNKHFTTCSSSNITFDGGDTNKYPSDDWAAWAKTIFDAPYPVSYTLKPIYELIPNATKAAVVKEAMEESLKRAQASLNATIAAMKANETHHHEPACCNV